MIPSQHISDSFKQGDFNVQTAEALFRAHGERVVDSYYLHPADKRIDQVILTLKPGSPASEVRPNVVKIDFRSPYEVTLSEVSPSNCTQWLMSHGNQVNAYPYLCALGEKTPTQFNVLVQLTHDISDHNARVKSISFIR